ESHGGSTCDTDGGFRRVSLCTNHSPAWVRGSLSCSNTSLQAAHQGLVRAEGGERVGRTEHDVLLAPATVLLAACWHLHVAVQVPAGSNREDQPKDCERERESQPHPSLMLSGGSSKGCVFICAASTGQQL